jgi:hypothetical protein
VSFVWKHQLRKHVLVSRDCDWVLVLHDGTPVNVKGGDQDVLDMVFRVASWVLRLEFLSR